MNKIFKLIQNRKLLLLIFVVIFLLLIILELLVPNCGKEEKVVKIEKGWGSDEVAQKLKDENLIKNKWIFVLYVWARGYNHHLQAGEYLLNSRMTIPKISKIIANGEVNPNWAKITIPEGWTNKQIETRLKENKIIGQDEKLPENLQGYLFPDTYYFEKNSGIDTVVDKMHENFLEKISEISKDLLADSSMRLPNAIIMASILEREVISDEDRAIVSGIFWKRIEKKYPLESCATIAYVLGVEKKQYSYEDTRVKSPYNTYTNIGLPPTPINNPGLSAIKAALYPKQSDYNFFLSAPDGTTIFSKTLEEHNTNKVRYLK